MPLREAIQRQRETLLGIARRYGATKLRLFGSVARGEERPDSDVDRLIDLHPAGGFGDCLGLAEQLEAVLHRGVELLLSRSLGPHFRPFVEAEARPV